MNRKKPSSNVSDAEALEIVRLHFSGKRSSEICRETGKSDRTVARISRIADGAIRLKEENAKPVTQTVPSISREAYECIKKAALFDAIISYIKIRDIFANKEDILAFVGESEPAENASEDGGKDV